MKTKLLKKVRERFSIEYHPNVINGVYPEIRLLDNHFKEPLRVWYIVTPEQVEQSEYLKEFKYRRSFYYLEEAKKDAYQHLVNRINECYKDSSPRRNKLKKLRIEQAKQVELKRKQEEKRLEAERKASIQKLWYQ